MAANPLGAASAAARGISDAGTKCVVHVLLHRSIGCRTWSGWLLRGVALTVEPVFSMRLVVHTVHRMALVRWSLRNTLHAVADDWEDWEDDNFQAPPLAGAATTNGQYETKGQEALAKAKEPDASKFAGEDEEEEVPEWQKSIPKPQDVRTPTAANRQCNYASTCAESSLTVTCFACAAWHS